MSRRTGILAFAAAALLLGACGAKSLREGESPFPAGRPVFADEAGAPLAGLPDAPEPLRLVLLDFPWCPPCAEVLRDVGRASGAFPPGAVRLYRILFDRERILSAGGVREAPPLRPAPAPPDAAAADPERLPTTTLTALSSPFREEFRLERAPVLLLLGRDGKVRKRWIGYSPALAASVTSEVTRSADALPKPPGK